MRHRRPSGRNLENTNFSKLENIPEGLIVGESGIPKNTQGVLGDLKSKALSSIEIVKKYDPTFELATATLLDIEKYDDLLTQELKPFFYASIKNHQITLEAAIILNEKTLNYQKIGRLINEHHLVLKDVLKITTPKIDAMINAAIQAGAYGAKIVGSGGGGSICVMASLENQQQVMIDIMKAGAKNVYPVSIVSSNNNCFI